MVNHATVEKGGSPSSRCAFSTCAAWSAAFNRSLSLDTCCSDKDSSFVLLARAFGKALLVPRVVPHIYVPFLKQGFGQIHRRKEVVGEHVMVLVEVVGHQAHHHPVAKVEVRLLVVPIAATVHVERGAVTRVWVAQTPEVRLLVVPIAAAVHVECDAVTRVWVAQTPEVRLLVVPIAAAVHVECDAVTRVWVAHTPLLQPPFHGFLGIYCRPRIWAVWGQGQLALTFKDYLRASRPVCRAPRPLIFKAKSHIRKHAYIYLHACVCNLYVPVGPILDKYIIDHAYIRQNILSCATV